MQPSDHQLAAALRVARVVDDAGNSTADLQSAYGVHLSQGEHRLDDLRAGELILLGLDLIGFTEDGALSSTMVCRALAAMIELDGIAYLRRLLTRRDDALARAELGAEGELVVLDACRAELVELGREHLAEAVSQVSLLDDTLGYDIVAPVIAGPPRWLEVKTASALRSGVFHFFLTRNEYDCGRREPGSWALVACARTTAGAVGIIGWCRAASLQPYLPEDNNGRWTEAMVNLPRSALFDGHPPPL